MFLDEIGELPLSMQSKLLRVLEQKTFVRLGGTRVFASDFRLVAATNRNLETEVAEGRFRQDLYYRINVVPLPLPPLRERGEDVLLLAEQFLGFFAKKHGHPQPRLSPNDEAKLMAYDWPGNIRELKNVMERAVLLSSGEHLKLDLATGPGAEQPHPFHDWPTMDEVQRRYMRSVMEKTGNRISGEAGAAEILGMDRMAVHRRMKKLGLT
jgi:transcriptional regulator with GAF, ATPase, and Fis domain